MNKGILLIITSLIFTLVIWVSGLSDNTQFSLNLFARMYGLIGILLLSWNYILATRLKILEELFDGLDNLYKVHHWIGKWGFLLILSHPATLILNALQNNLDLNIYLIPSNNTAYSFGVLGLYFLIILLFVTIFMKLPYHLWKLTHDFMGIPLFILFLHILLVSSDTSRNLILRYWILGYVLIAIASYIYKRFIYEYINKFIYVISEIKILPSLTKEISFKLVNGNVRYTKGNFVFIKRFEGSNSDEIHPFSITKYDNSGNISLGIKSVGDYTSTIDDWKIGDKFLLYGPYGRFGTHFKPDRKELWIAGGIGITPFLSVLDEYKSTNKSINAHLIYAVNDVTQIPFVDDLNGYCQSIKGFTYEVWDNKSKGWFNPKDYVSNDIQKYLICASEKSTIEIIRILKSFGVKGSKIRKELFKLY